MKRRVMKRFRSYFGKVDAFVLMKGKQSVFYLTD